MKRKCEDCPEMSNLSELLAYVTPNLENVPVLNRIELGASMIPLSGRFGGDHISFIDFKNDFDLDSIVEKAEEGQDNTKSRRLRALKSRVGILVQDASGHLLTDAVLTAKTYQAFRMGVLYELEKNGRITTSLFDKLNTRLYNSTSSQKFVTALYGEIYENGEFRFISSGHPAPLIFSNEYNMIMPIADEYFLAQTPLGVIPSKRQALCERVDSEALQKGDYGVNKLQLMMPGDIMILYTDGLSDHKSADGEDYFPRYLETFLKRNKKLSAREISKSLHRDILSFGPTTDDVSFVIVKYQ